MIEFQHVSKTYPNGVKGLKDVNLTIDQGEFVAIIGLSGAGKSTLIRTINRMIDVTEGTLTVDGVDVMTLRGKSMRRFRRKIGMIFQSFNLITRSTAIKNVLSSMVPDMNFFRVLFGIFTREQKLQALEALDKVGILDKAYTRCDQLSGGQQQRVALARTLNQNPTIDSGRRARGRAGPRDRPSGHERLQAHQRRNEYYGANQHSPCGSGPEICHPRHRYPRRRDRLRRPHRRRDAGGSGQHLQRRFRASRPGNERAKHEKEKRSNGIPDAAV